MTALFDWFQRKSLGGLLLLALVLLVVFPLTLDMFRLNLLGKYLSYSFVALGLVMLWGYGGVLSLGQGVFFGLGGYCMAMFLKLEASDPVTTSSRRSAARISRKPRVIARSGTAAASPAKAAAF